MGHCRQIEEVTFKALNNMTIFHEFNIMYIMRTSVVTAI